MATDDSSSEEKSLTRVFLENLPKDVKKGQVGSTFSRFGRIAKVYLIYDPPGSGFVEFFDNRDAEYAANQMDGADYMGEKVSAKVTRGGVPRGRGMSFFGGSFRGSSRGFGSRGDFRGGRGFRGGDRGGGFRGRGFRGSFDGGRDGYNGRGDGDFRGYGRHQRGRGSSFNNYDNYKDESYDYESYEDSHFDKYSDMDYKNSYDKSYARIGGKSYDRDYDKFPEKSYGKDYDREYVKSYGKEHEKGYDKYSRKDYSDSYDRKFSDTEKSYKNYDKEYKNYEKDLDRGCTKSGSRGYEDGYGDIKDYARDGSCDKYVKRKEENGKYSQEKLDGHPQGGSGRSGARRDSYSTKSRSYFSDNYPSPPTYCSRSRSRSPMHRDFKGSRNSLSPKDSKMYSSGKGSLDRKRSPFTERKTSRDSFKDYHMPSSSSYASASGGRPSRGQRY